MTSTGVLDCRLEPTALADISAIGTGTPEQYSRKFASVRSLLYADASFTSFQESHVFKAFKEFAFKGNMIDMAVGIIIGGAFGLLVKSLVNNIITPAISGIFKVPDFSQLFVALDGNSYESLAALDKAGAAAIKYGVFINDFVNLMIVAFSLFLMVHYVINAVKKKEQAAPPPPPSTQEVLLTEIRDLLKAK